jgi:histidinol phosphatase-like enzyme
MTKLIIFDKDGTLTQPISGSTFVQHPHDQQLRPGVAQKLEQLRAEGVAMAISSNQGGCAVFEIVTANLKSGMRLRDDLYPDGFEILSVKPSGEKSTQIEFDSEGLPVVRLEPNNRMFEVFYKSTRMAIEEMKFAMGLTGINTAFFCPDMAGERCLWLDREKANDPIECRNLGDSNAIDGLNCRKPEPGMLIVARSFEMWREEDLIEVGGVQSWKPGLCLMVGDRPEDQAAGFDFCWADDFFGGGHE